MEKRNIIVIGASAGGFEAIKRVVPGLPHISMQPFLIVWHMSPGLRHTIIYFLQRFLRNRQKECYQHGDVTSMQSKKSAVKIF